MVTGFALGEISIAWPTIGLGLLAVNAVLSFVAASNAEHKGYGFWPVFCLGCIGSFAIAFIVAALLPDRKRLHDERVNAAVEALECQPRQYVCFHCGLVNPESRQFCANCRSDMVAQRSKPAVKADSGQ